MAASDDDFSLIAADTNHHIAAAASSHHNHHHFTLPHTTYFPKSPPIRPSPPPSNPNHPAAAVDFSAAAAVDDDSAFPYDSDPNGAASIESSQIEKRTHIDDGDCAVSTSKRSKIDARGGGGGGGGGGVEHRKDREEWSDYAIECLLGAYTEKYNQLNRGNLRGRDWEEVAGVVSERCENQIKKTVEQCKNKVDNLKKRYKLERQRMSAAGVGNSHWPWFRRMEAIVGVAGKGGSDEEGKGGGSGGGAGSGGRQTRRTVLSPSTQVVPVNNLKPKPMPTPRWHRVVFKISGAAFAGDGSCNVDPKVTMHIAREVAIACQHGVQVAIVVGGQNFFSGDAWINATGSDRSTTYQIGMMATLMNAVLLQSTLEKVGVQTRVQTAFALPEVGEPYNRQRAVRHLEKGRVVIFGGVGAGSGNPLFSTDTVAALRASEIQAVAVVKGINVDVVDDCNTRNCNIACEHISFREFASRGLSCMDIMALTLCEENGMPVMVFGLLESGNISRALCGEQVGTLIDQTGMVS
ncbi:hypothetical protein Droror1_Dr00008816 [Drosera rotundifolia]